MYRFLLRPKWIGLTVVVIVAVLGMIRLGMWQHDRLETRRAFNTEVRANDAAPLVDLAEIDLAQPAEVAYRRVQVTGRYLPDATIEVVNRSQGGFPGRNVVDVLDLGDGTGVLVNRGFVPSLDPTPPPPPGEITVIGRLRADEVRRLGQPSIPTGEPLDEVPRIEVAAIQPQVPLTLLPMFVERIDSDPADSDALQPIAFPDLDDGPHFSYMVQWWIFAAAAAAGWVLAVRREVSEQRRRGQPPTPPPGDDAPATATAGTPTTSSH